MWQRVRVVSRVGAGVGAGVDAGADAVRSCAVGLGMVGSGGMKVGAMCADALLGQKVGVKVVV